MPLSCNSSQPASLETAPHRCFGNLPARIAFAVGKPGADRLAYQSQFNGATNRAHAGKEKIKSRLIADLDPDEWDEPPKPKWMRWKTYDRHVERFDHY